MSGFYARAQADTQACNIMGWGITLPARCEYSPAAPSLAALGSGLDTSWELQRTRQQSPRDFTNLEDTNKEAISQTCVCVGRYLVLCVLEDMLSFSMHVHRIHCASEPVALPLKFLPRKADYTLLMANAVCCMLAIIGHCACFTRLALHLCSERSRHSECMTERIGGSRVCTKFVVCIYLEIQIHLHKDILI
jgi:hypothetical protein